MTCLLEKVSLFLYCVVCPSVGDQVINSDPANRSSLPANHGRLHRSAQKCGFKVLFVTAAALLSSDWPCWMNQMGRACPERKDVACLLIGSSCARNDNWDMSVVYKGQQGSRWNAPARLKHLGSPVLNNSEFHRRGFTACILCSVCALFLKNGGWTGTRKLGFLRW